MTRRQRTPVLLAGAIALTAFLSAAAAAQQTAAPALTADASIRFDGANTMGIGMIPPLANAWAKKNHLPMMRTEQSTDPLEYVLSAEAAEGVRKIRMDVRFHGTPTGAEPLIRGAADFWMAARPARESDLEAVRRRGVASMPPLQQFLAPGSEHVVGLDGVAVIVHPSNPVHELTFAQMKDIFTGKITNWSQAGGPDLAISVYAPDPSFGTFERVCASVIGAASTQQCVQQMVRLAQPHFKSVEDLADAVAGNPGGIGWTGLMTKRSGRAITIITECGSVAEADAFYVKAEEYPLSSRNYFYTMPGRQISPAARNFLDFTLSAEGQAALGASGAVDLNPSLSTDDYAANRLEAADNAFDDGKTRIRPADVRTFEEATTRAQRISITFRFQEGTDNLDSRAEVDIGRLAALMHSPAYAKAQLILIGYSASRGDYAANRNLSRNRAAAVRERLTRGHGLRNVTSFGVGPASPIACNLDNSPTATLNQRVEAWIRMGSGG